MSAAAPSGYPGNPSLPKEVRDKILSTFRHTLNLFREGKTDDCLIGCDFILKMDPRFAPARQLLEKTKNPAAGVDVGELEALVAATPTRQERVASVDADRLLVRAAESLNARDFDAAIGTADQVLLALPGNRDAQAILEKARQRKEAGPQVEVARQRAMMALDSNRPAEARAALERMRSIDPDHPSVALLERRISGQAEAKREVGESTNPGLSLDEGESASPARAPGPELAEPAGSGGGLGDLSLDSLSLDESFATPEVSPPPDFLSRHPSTGPLGAEEAETEPAPSALDAGGPADMWGPAPGADEPAQPSGPDGDPAAFSMGAAEPEPEPEPPSPRQEIDGLLARGDEAARAGSRQQAIEIWSRIFLIDINNSEAVGRIEKTRQEMADGNRRVAEGLRHGREKFEAGDFTAAREAFLEVLAFDETDATARSYLDRIEQELARPSAGLDLSRKSPAGDILAEEMAEASAPDFEPEPEPIEALEPAGAPKLKPSAVRRAPDKRFVIALGGALVLAIAVGAYFLLRGGGAAPTHATAAGGASLERATELFREGKIPETIAELKRIGPQHPDYARAQKLLTSLTRKTEGGEAAAGGDLPGEPAGGAEAPAEGSGPAAAAVAQRDVAEKALAEKRYIDALKNFALASSAFQDDPSFSQAMGEASEKVAELTPAVKLYNEGEYDTAIPILWRIFQADRSNQDARSYLLRCYYNQGIAQLQNGLFPKAAESFSEVIAIDPDDAEAARHKRFADRYLKGDLDLMGRIYVRHVQQRP
jgi:tetratricopeptide (TPR) repeat protein